MGIALLSFFGLTSPGILLITLGILASASLYMAGMAANDLFDVEIDAWERPQRPLPSERISLGAAWRLVLGLQGLALALGAWMGSLPLMAITFTLLMTYLYNTGGKWSPAGPLLMGLCRYGNALIGLSLAGTLPPWPAFLIPGVTLVYIINLTRLSQVEVKGLSSPWRPRLLLLSALLPALSVFLGLLPREALSLSVLLPALWLGPSLYRLSKDPSPGAVRGLVKAGVIGVAWLNFALALSMAGVWEAMLILIFLLLGWGVGRTFYTT